MIGEERSGERREGREDGVEGRMMVERCREIERRGREAEETEEDEERDMRREERSRVEVEESDLM
jgi:hypothetical protein